MGWERLDLLARLAHIHHHDDPEVIIRDNRAIQHTDERRARSDALHHGAEHVKLGEETARHGNADEQQAEGWSIAASSGEVRPPDPGNLPPGGASPALRMADHGERAHIHGGIGCRVDVAANAAHRILGTCHGECHQQISGMRDRGDGSRRLTLVCTSAPTFPKVMESAAATHRSPNRPGALMVNTTPQQYGERRRLRCRGHETHDRSRCTFVDIGRPNVERRAQRFNPRPTNISAMPI